MKFIGIRDFRTNSKNIWKKLKTEKSMVITSNGKPIAILSTTTEHTLEESISSIRRAQALESLASLRFQKSNEGLNSINLKEINKEIKKYRKEKMK